jgi:hypothetical protein
MLGLIPLAAGAFRLTELAGGAEITSANARFFASPLPVVLHIVSAGVYAILGAFQFARPVSGGAGPGGTARPGGSWFHADCWLGFPRCG